MPGTDGIHGNFCNFLYIDIDWEDDEEEKKQQTCPIAGYRRTDDAQKKQSKSVKIVDLLPILGHWFKLEEFFSGSCFAILQQRYDNKHEFILVQIKQGKIK